MYQFQLPIFYYTTFCCVRDWPIASDLDNALFLGFLGNGTAQQKWLTGTWNP